MNMSNLVAVIVLAILALLGAHEHVTGTGQGTAAQAATLSGAPRDLNTERIS